MRLNPFEWFDVIIGKKKLSNEDINKSIEEHYEYFMLNRIMSNDNTLLKNSLNTNKKGFTDKMHFELSRAFYKMSYGNKQVFIPYAKGTKEPEEVKIISDYFYVSEETAKRYLECISEEELNTIKEYYRLLDDLNKKTKVK